MKFIPRYEPVCISGTWYLKDNKNPLWMSQPMPQGEAIVTARTWNLFARPVRKEETGDDD